jgi:hypothetical protein
MQPKNKKQYQEKLDWDDMSYGEASHHIGKKTTEKVHKSQKDFKRNPKHKNRNFEIDDD